MYTKIIPAIQKANKVAIFSHTHPDGDAMGSSYSLKIALQSMGKEAEVFLEEDQDSNAWSLIRGKEESGLSLSDCDLMVALDCGDIYRLGKYEEIYGKFENTIAIDHHITHKVFAKQGSVIADISSTCELIYGLYRALEIPISADIATNLYIGLVSDTGNFKYSSVTAKTHLVAAELIDAGIDFSGISKVLFDTKSIEYLCLMRSALSKLELYETGKISVLHLSEEDFQKAGLTEQCAVGIVTIPISIQGVEVGVYIRSRGNGEYKVSLRSNKKVDVAVIADHFGGGGHVRASGYSVYETTVEEITENLVQEIKKYL